MDTVKLRECSLFVDCSSQHCLHTTRDLLHRVWKQLADARWVSAYKEAILSLWPVPIHRTSRPQQHPAANMTRRSKDCNSVNLESCVTGMGSVPLFGPDTQSCKQSRQALVGMNVQHNGEKPHYIWLGKPCNTNILQLHSALWKQVQRHETMETMMTQIKINRISYFSNPALTLTIFMSHQSEHAVKLEVIHLL